MEHPGKMLPAIARYLIATYTQPGEYVCDPMAGLDFRTLVGLCSRVCPGQLEFEGFFGDR
jgi:hypothetical protein